MAMDMAVEPWTEVGSTTTTEAPQTAVTAAQPGCTRRFCPWCSLNVLHYDGKALSAGYRSLCDALEDEHKPDVEFTQELNILSMLVGQALSEIPADVRSTFTIIFRVVPGQAPPPPPAPPHQAAASTGANVAGLPMTILRSRLCGWGGACWTSSWRRCGCCC